MRAVAQDVKQLESCLIHTQSACPGSHCQFDTSSGPRGCVRLQSWEGSLLGS